jgi:hypothetical protein
MNMLVNEMQDISWLDKNLLLLQDRLCSMILVLTEFGKKSDLVNNKEHTQKVMEDDLEGVVTHLVKIQSNSSSLE